MKAIRRSLKGDKDPRPLHHQHHLSHSHSPHLSLTPKSAIAILPPKKVIKALYDHNPDPENPQELSFCKGDFFHVISREDDEDWYEACNPLIPSARGLVPVSFFEVIGKTGRDSSGSNGNSSSNSNHNNLLHHQRGSSLIDLHQHQQQSSARHSPSQSHSHSHSHSHSLSISHPVPHQHHHHNNKKEPHDSGFSDRFPSSAADSAQSPNRSPLQHQQNPSLSASLPRFSTMGKGSGAMVYGLVQYDFKAERPDELEARAGEAIIVIAQSNPEWFVAKPIGRLGGPGLIPVSFLELKDMQTGQPVTDPLEAVRRAGVPKVEEWKKMTAEYKNSSITLGKIDSMGGGGGGGGGGNGTMSGVPFMTSSMDKMSIGGGHMSQNGGFVHNRNTSKGTLSHHHVSHPYPQNYQPPPPAPLMAPVAASIPRYCFDNDKYWYIIEAKMEDGRCWELPRFYHDFYDFQIALLTQFEEEAGNRGKPRTLPFMPGPVTHVTDAISNGRRQNLDEYIKKLLAMPPHISRCTLVRQLFAPRAGDFEIDPSAFGEDARYSTGSHQSSNHEASRTVSRQSSQAHLNSATIPAVAVAATATATATAADRTSHQRNQSQTNGPPPMNRQPSSLTQVSSQSGGGGSGAMKVKVFYQDDLIAIRVPNDINLQQLREKLMDRLKTGDGIILQYKDEPSGTVADLNTDEDLDTAIQRNAKLTLIVG